MSSIVICTIKFNIYTSMTEEKMIPSPITLESLNDKFETFYEFNFKTFQTQMLGFRSYTEDKFNLIQDCFVDFNYKVDEIKLRAGNLEVRMDRIECRMDGIERRMDAVEKRLDKIEKRLDAIEDRLDRIEQRLERIERVIMELVEIVKRHDTEIREIKLQLSM